MSEQLQENKPQSNIYRCARGHQIFAEEGSWITMNLQFTQPDGSVSNRSFNYCMTCFAEWAEHQWPLTCEPVNIDQAPPNPTAH